MAITKQRKLIKTHQSSKNTNEQFFFFAKIFILFRGMIRILNIERMMNDYIFSLEGKNNTRVYLLLL